MADIPKIGSTPPVTAQPLTPEQQKALKNLHDAATQLEGVFLQMLMSAMNDTVPKESIFGQQSASEETWEGMLTDQRAQSMAQSGAFGLAKQLEDQLRPGVLSDAARESQANTKRGSDL